MMKQSFKVLAITSACVLQTPAVAQTSPSPFTTAHRYDNQGRETGVISPDPDQAGPLAWRAKRVTYDGRGLLVKVEMGELSSWPSESTAPIAWTGFTVYQTDETAYDVNRRKVQEVTRTGAAGAISLLKQFSYDALGRLQCTAVRMDSAQWGSQTNACAPQTTGANGPDRITKNVYDAAGQLVQVRKAVGTADEAADATYSYTPDGKQQYVIDANGNRAQLVYDGFDRQVQWIFPSATRPSAYNNATQATALSTAGSVNAADYEQYGYDANGNRTSLRKRDGSVLTYTYDALNRVTLKIVPERSGLGTTYTRDVYYGYDLQGHQLYARFDSATGQGITNTWDGFGRQLSSTQAIDGASRQISYQYDADGNRTRVTYPDGNYVTYSYDGLDRPWQILRSGAGTLANYTYDAAGRRSGFNSAISTSYGYDGIGRVSSLANNPAANAGYNNSWSFSYNPASQITSQIRSNDLFAWNGAVNVNRGYTTNGLNQYTVAGSASFGYDGNGNLTSDGSTAFTYDVENRLVSASGAKSAGLRYDPLGRLYEVSGTSGTTRFLYDGDALAGEYDTSNNLLRRYVHGADIAADDPIAWYEGSGFASTDERHMRPDWQGSISIVTDSAGSQIIATNTYDEWGIPGSNNAGRFQYTGQAWLPELGMYHYKARIYSPTLGRFLQTDPIGYKDQVNLYAYVENDPLNKTDFSGKFTCVSNGDGTQRCTSNGSIADNAALALYAAFVYAERAVQRALHNDPAPPPPRGTTDTPGNKPPRTGEPGSTVRGGTGSRTYGPDGYPDVDRDHPHGGGPDIERGDHSHDWGRPAGGGPPTNEDRGPAREPRPGDPPPPRGPNVPPPTSIGGQALPPPPPPVKSCSLRPFDSSPC